MRINSISASGLKSGDFNHNLTAVNLVVGPNFAGKTSVIDAIRLALVGYLPELGKTNGDTFTLCRGSKLAVTASTAKGDVFRTWIKNGKGGIKGTVSSLAPAIPSVLMDANVYFSQGDKDRMRYVFGVANLGDDWTGARVIAELKAVKATPEHTEDHEAKLREVVEEINASDDAREDCGQTLQDWLEGVIASQREALKSAKQSVERLEKTVQGIMQVAGEAEAVADQTAAITAKQAELATAQARQAELRRAIKRLDDATPERNDLTAALARLTAQDVDGRLATVTAEEVALAKEVQGYDAGPANRLTTQRNELAQARANLEGEARMVKRQNEAISKRLDELQSAPCCPYCHSKKKGWQETVQTEINNDRDLWLQKAAEIIAKAADIQGQLEALQPAIDAALDAERHNAIATEAIRVKRQLLSTLHAQAQQKAVWEARLAALTADGDKAALDTELSIVEGTTATARESLTELQTSQRAFDRARLEEQQNAQVVLAANSAKVSRDILAAVVEALETLQRQLVDAAFGGIMATANRLVGDILLSPLAYDKDSGEIGRMQGGRFISHRTFSGTEKALAYAAISVALAADSPCKIVLIDELGRLDNEHKTALLTRMVTLTRDGIIDQFVGVDTSSSDVEGVNEVRIVAGVNEVRVG